LDAIIVLDGNDGSLDPIIVGIMDAELEVGGPFGFGVVEGV